MSKLLTCLVCKKRKVPRQEWKTPEERDYCLTCYTFKRYCQTTMETLQLLANNRKINRRVVMVLVDSENPEEKLFRSIGYQNRVLLK